MRSSLFGMIERTKQDLNDAEINLSQYGMKYLHLNSAFGCFFVETESTSK